MRVQVGGGAVVTAGAGKRSVRTAKLHDAKGAMLTVRRSKRTDGSEMVQVIYTTGLDAVTGMGGTSKVGMVSTHVDAAAATARFDELVVLAEKAGWKLAVSSPKVLESVFERVPAAARAGRS